LIQDCVSARGQRQTALVCGGGASITIRLFQFGTFARRVQRRRNT
jgi:hypothetical protein